MRMIKIARRGLIAGLAVTAMAPASAMATHNGTCPGFSDPVCNVSYFNDHTVGPVLETLEPVMNIIGGALDTVNYTVDRTLCRYFGACG